MGEVNLRHAPATQGFDQSVTIVYDGSLHERNHTLDVTDIKFAVWRPRTGPLLTLRSRGFRPLYHRGDEAHLGLDVRSAVVSEAAGKVVFESRVFLTVSRWARR